eukprot:TRINITY_DN709_c0_g2_i5.p1 TRINITY_DN709_c0_g2~~TRINITY_DN709_c0_g2_i5.p1  ORF type:complete len:251 (+),score=84.12 TRINITY_DN709_c0_g2_i5:852-1604(+)
MPFVNKLKRWIEKKKQQEKKKGRGRKLKQNDENYMNSYDMNQPTYEAQSNPTNSLMEKLSQAFSAYNNPQHNLNLPPYHQNPTPQQYGYPVHLDQLNHIQNPPQDGHQMGANLMQMLQSARQDQFSQQNQLPYQTEHQPAPLVDEAIYQVGSSLPGVHYHNENLDHVATPLTFNSNNSNADLSLSLKALLKVKENEKNEEPRVPEYTITPIEEPGVSVPSHVEVLPASGDPWLDFRFNRPEILKHIKPIH